MKTVKYWLSFLSLILLIIIPCGGIYYLTTQPGFNLVSFVSDNMAVVCVVCVVWVIAFKACNTWYEKSKYMNIFLYVLLQTLNQNPDTPAGLLFPDMKLRKHTYTLIQSVSLDS